jgi:hypothetical protein
VPELQHHRQPLRMWANNRFNIHRAIIGDPAFDYKKSISRKRSLFFERPTEFASSGRRDGRRRTAPER